MELERCINLMGLFLLASSQWDMLKGSGCMYLKMELISKASF